MNQRKKINNLENTLNKVFDILVNNKDQQILPILIQYKENVSEYDKLIRDKYYKFTAFGYLRERNLIEAENYIQKLDNNESLDVEYVLTTINFHLREFEKAVKYGNNYLKQFDMVSNCNEEITKTNNYKNNILNFVGQSLMMLRRYDEADEIYNKAVLADTKHPQTYINMIRLAEHLKDKETASEILETALQNCPDSIELKILAGITNKSQDKSYSQA
jgi:tetratricopeptide (TPR) repeat protein